jgi:ankyrin repeat protein
VALPELVNDELSSISAMAKHSQEGEEKAQSLLNACASEFGSALHIAASRSNDARSLSCLELLLKSGANVNKTCKDVGTPLHVSVRTRRHDTNVVELLLEHEAEPNAKDHHGNSPLHHAILERDVASVGALIRHGADLNSRIGAHGNAAQTARQLHAWGFTAGLSGLCEQDAISAGQ